MCAPHGAIPEVWFNSLSLVAGVGVVAVVLIGVLQERPLATSMGRAWAELDGARPFNSDEEGGV